jgi:hypothetical protein
MKLLGFAVALFSLTFATPNYAFSVDKLDGFWDCYSTKALENSEVRFEEIGALIIDAKRQTYRFKGNINALMFGIVPVISSIYYEGGKLKPADADSILQEWEVYEIGTMASQRKSSKNAKDAADMPEWKIVSFTDNFFVGESSDTQFTCRRIIN